MKKLIKKVRPHHFREIFIYGMVGGMAWVVQTVMYLLLTRVSIFPSVAMIIGTAGGSIVSYFGHTRFTFQKEHKFSRSEFIKFIVTSIIGVCINIGGVRLITKVLLLHSDYAVIPTIFTPLVTFLISKFWAFK